MNLFLVRVVFQNFELHAFICEVVISEINLKVWFEVETLALQVAQQKTIVLCILFLLLLARLIFWEDLILPEEDVSRLMSISLFF